MAYQRGSLVKLHRKAGDDLGAAVSGNQGPRASGFKMTCPSASFATSPKKKMHGERSIA